MTADGNGDIAPLLQRAAAIDDFDSDERWRIIGDIQERTDRREPRQPADDGSQEIRDALAARLIDEDCDVRAGKVTTHARPCSPTPSTRVPAEMGVGGDPGVAGDVAPMGCATQLMQ